MFTSKMPANVIKMSDHDHRSLGSDSVELSMQEVTAVDSKAENNALRYLARREYSRLELYQRLISKGYKSDVVNHLLDHLAAKNYQSDERYADMYIRSRANVGDGPFKIKLALRSKGVKDSLSDSIFDQLSIDWFERARFVKVKRFGDARATDITEYSKQIRYLKSKGFYQDHIDSVVEYSHYS